MPSRRSILLPPFIMPSTLIFFVESPSVHPHTHGPRRSVHAEEGWNQVLCTVYVDVFGCRMQYPCKTHDVLRQGKEGGSVLVIDFLVSGNVSGRNHADGQNDNRLAFT
ncbi:hypothetical protein CPSG_01595 [Coccidioides posadasii str. Silveira]|uniref:Uncharacterized protein n=1 Tax=Coccidioides posadasii (strain RMSCC 757 / Silveira) TaxID=443226 RepID=E9CVW2_COCPS|nr:hypothetical protein CPSG_01595 [Coccidioides posadasii str. Silveira]